MRYALLRAAFVLPTLAAGQQIADTDFRPPIARPAFATGRGPVIAVDEAHFNFHTADGRYAPFADLLRRDGYQVRRSTTPFSATALKEVRLLVVANALHERNGRGDWSLPTPAAFSAEEIAAVKTWVDAGGSLLLIADHMPFPGANAALAGAFGFTFSNGFAYADTARRSLPVFTTGSAMLQAHPILRGRSPGEQVDTVATFTGSAFRCPPKATPLLVLPPGSKSLEPAVAWQFDAATPAADVGDWSQGAVLVFGRGRVAVFGEAAMFTAQRSGPNKNPMGMNAPPAKQNAQFLLNVIHWLTGVLDAPALP